MLTGLKDKHGNDIHDGSTLRFDSDNARDTVVYCKETDDFVQFSNNPRFFTTSDRFHSERYEVIKEL